MSCGGRQVLDEGRKLVLGDRLASDHRRRDRRQRHDGSRSREGDSRDDRVEGLNGGGPNRGDGRCEGRRKERPYVRLDDRLLYWNRSVGDRRQSDEGGRYEDSRDGGDQEGIDAGNEVGLNGSDRRRSHCDVLHRRICTSERGEGDGDEDGEGHRDCSDRLSRCSSRRLSRRSRDGRSAHRRDLDGSEDLQWRLSGRHSRGRSRRRESDWGGRRGDRHSQSEDGEGVQELCDSLCRGCGGESDELCCGGERWEGFGDGRDGAVRGVERLRRVDACLKDQTRQF